MYQVFILSLVLFQGIFAEAVPCLKTPFVCEWKAGAFGPEKALLEEGKKQQEQESFLQMIPKIQDSDLFLLSATQAGTCVGFIVVAYDKRKKQICVEMLIFKDSPEGKEVAEELLGKAQERFDADSIVVACQKENEFLRTFYAESGFKPTRGIPGGKSPLYYTGFWKDVSR